MSDTNDAAATTPAPTASGAGAAGEQPVNWQEKAEEWQRRFSGLQGKYQQEATKWADTQARLADTDAKWTALLGEKAAVDTELAALRSQHDTELTALRSQHDTALTALRGQHDTATGELEIERAAHGRLRLIATEFPDLLAFESQGLLPDGSGDELKQKLGLFKEALASQGKQTAAQMLNGLTPPAQNKPPDKTAKEHLDEAFAAMRAGKLDEYDAAYSRYLELSQKESKP